VFLDGVKLVLRDADRDAAIERVLSAIEALLLGREATRIESCIPPASEVRMRRISRMRLHLAAASAELDRASEEVEDLASDFQVM
jgi:hypothetical protein